MTGKKKRRTSPCIGHLVITRCLSCKLEKRGNFYFYFGGEFLDIKRNVLLLVVVIIPRGRQPFRGGKDSTGSKIVWLLILNAKRHFCLQHFYLKITQYIKDDGQSTKKAIRISHLYFLAKKFSVFKKEKKLLLLKIILIFFLYFPFTKKWP